jgi:hypothetical protein
MLQDRREKERREVTIQVWAGPLRDQEIKKILERGLRRRDALTKSLRAQQARPLPASLDTDSLSRLMLALLQGFILHQLRLPRSWNKASPEGRAGRVEWQGFPHFNAEGVTHVNRSALLILAAALAGTLHAQAPNPLVGEMKQQYNNIKNNLLKAADKMPEAAYTFKATPDVRTFGELIGHISGQFRACNAVKGEQKQIDTSKTAKADLVAALKASFDACDAAWDSITDATAFEMIQAGRGGQRSKLGVLIGTTIVHNNEEYGYLAVYMRLKGVVPPSSEPRPMAK